MSESRPARAPADLSLPGLARPPVSRGRRWLAAFGLSAAVTVALASAAPLTLDVTFGSGLRAALTSGVNVTVSVAGVTDFDGFARFQQEAGRAVESRLGPYLGTATPFATIAPLFPVSLNDGQTTPELSDLRLTAAYFGGLAAHVTMLAGELPPDGLGGGYTAVTMSQAAADQAGLHLSDRLCVDFGPGAVGRAASWCARLVGLWQPRGRSDPFWGGSAALPRLMMGRYDFFELLKLQPPQAALAGRRYAPDPAGIDRRNASAVAGLVSQTRAALSGRRGFGFDTSLDRARAGFTAAERRAGSTVHVLGGALVLLALSLVALAASRFLDLQAREVALLRARGWPLGRTWSLLFAQLGTVALLAVPPGLAAAALAVTALGLGWLASPDLALSGADLATTALALAAALVAILLVVAALAAATAGLEVDVLRQAGSRPPRAWWHRLGMDLLLAVAAAPLLALRLFDLPFGPAGEVAGSLAPSAAVALIGLAALRLLPAAALLAGDDLPGTLAGWQLRRRPDQHAGLAFLLVLALATAVFSAVGLASEPQAVLAGTIRRGLQLSLAGGLFSALVMALAGFGIHFRAIARDRRREYAVLTANGLPSRAMEDSLAVEQDAVLGFGLVAGAALGLVLVLAVRPGDLPAAPLAAAAGALAVAVALLPMGWLVRQAAGRFDLLDELGQSG